MVDYNSHPESFTQARQQMVEQQIAARGVRSRLVLKAMTKVPREAFLPKRLRDFAYQDSPLPIAQGQTISQPYIVALMTEALQLSGGERVLEIGTGSGYAAAVLAEIAAQVYTLERHADLAESARQTLTRLEYRNIKVTHSDGTLGWPAAAPYQGIVVAAGAPLVPQALKQQLAIGGRLVIPVGSSEREQTLMRVTRTDKNHYEEEQLSDVRFVPLIGEAGWPGRPEHSAQRKAATLFDIQRPKKNLTGSLPANARTRAHAAISAPPASLPEAQKASVSQLIAEAAEPIASIENADLNQLLQRIGDSRVVLIGEASHGTSEFYQLRARITQKLIEEKGFNMVAVEADWPDASRIDHYVRHLDAPPAEWTAFTRFPTWMWRNEEVADFVDWLHNRNAQKAHSQRVGFHGLDLYSLYSSIDTVLKYLDEVDPEVAQIARQRYACLTPWQADPASYGRAVLSERTKPCTEDVVAMLADLLQKRLQYVRRDGERFMDAVQNARLVANAERYYRAMYEDFSSSWNLRDSHMFETLESLLEFHGPDSKAVVWEHNSHIGDASATDMKARGQHNVGQLCRQAFGEDAYLIGFGTHTGTVAATSGWDQPMEIKQVRPSLRNSWERVCHDCNIPAFMMGLRNPQSPDLQRQLHAERLERAIGVIYRPESERASHYFTARLADQFDEYIWFDNTKAVTPLSSQKVSGMPLTYPFGL